ncbi:4Fe-4S dicluster domain-containing protein [[Eubacterium] cellulosolvens]
MSMSIAVNGIVAVIDVSKCVNCRACTVACKDLHALNDYPPYSAGMPFRGQKWVRVEEIERGTFPKVRFASVPIFCQMCDNAPCIEAATGGAVYKRPDGIVIIDPVKSKGQKQIVNSCPYGVIFWNEEKEIPQKCTWCVQRLEKGENPRCMQACTGDAIHIGEVGILDEYLRKQGAPLHPEYGALPRVWFIGLPKTFIAGSLVDSKGECLAGAEVTATEQASGTVQARATSDFIGDFWLDGLQAKKTYEVAISKAGKTKKISVTLDTDTNLGDIQL